MTPDPSVLARDVSPRTRGLFLKNLADFLTELARVQAGFVPALADWRQRKEFPAQVFRTMRRVQDLRGRGRELGVSFAEMHFSAEVAGRRVIEVVCAAPAIADLFQSGVVQVNRALVTAIEDYLRRNEGVYDLPSVPHLEATRAELREQIGWAERALSELAAAGAKPTPGYAAQVDTALGDLPPALLEHSGRTGGAVKQSRRSGVLPFGASLLPAGFRHLEFGPEAVPADAPYAVRAKYIATNFLQEVQATDSCASMLFEAPDMPWEFYLDLSRHMWDEARHSMFGERKLEELGSSAAAEGLSGKAYEARQTLQPVDRYAALTTQEADAFPGKHAGLKEALANGDTVSAMAWSYDIADETQHVRFGTKWLPVLIEQTGDPRSVGEVQSDSRRWRETVLAGVYTPAATSFRK
jgi:hypothetical protein